LKLRLYNYYIKFSEQFHATVALVSEL